MRRALLIGQTEWTLAPPLVGRWAVKISTSVPWWRAPGREHAAAQPGGPEEDSKPSVTRRRSVAPIVLPMVVFVCRSPSIV